jgi:prephenate dehydratase
MIRCAFQGEPGAFSEEVVQRYFAGAVEAIAKRDFADVGSAVARGEVDCGVLPIENTLAGSVGPSYEVLAAEALRVIGEAVLPIHHCVLGLPGASLEGVRRVLSHPVALAQCTRFLRSRPDLQAIAVYDTAGAAGEVALRQDPQQAAIAGRRAAERYGLEVLARNVEDRANNQTRFLIVAASEKAEPRGDATQNPDASWRTLLLVETDNIPGALVSVLLPFANHEINLAKLEARPAAEPWKYRFFLEMDASTRAPSMEQALAEVGRVASLRVLGSYRRGMGAGGI